MSLVVQYKDLIEMKLKTEKVLYETLSSNFFILFGAFFPIVFLIIAFVEATLKYKWIFFGFIPVTFFYLFGAIWFIEQLEVWRKNIKKKENKILKDEYFKNMKELPIKI